jgi:hypothetical protein
LNGVLVFKDGRITPKVWLLEQDKLKGGFYALVQRSSITTYCMKNKNLIKDRLWQ